MTKVRVRSDRRTQRNSSWPGDSALHPKAEYICADLSIGLRFPLAVARRIIHFGEEQISHVRAYYRGADISVLILCEAHKPHRRQFRINYELILSEARPHANHGVEIHLVELLVHGRRVRPLRGIHVHLARHGIGRGASGGTCASAIARRRLYTSPSRRGDGQSPRRMVELIHSMKLWRLQLGPQRSNPTKLANRLGDAARGLSHLIPSVGLT
jgi:hypothetical protein